MANKQDIHKILSRIKYLPNSPITEKNVGEIVDMFFVILKDLSFELLDKAALFYLGEENPYFPMPGKLRTKALELQTLAMQIPTAAEAWGMVLNREQVQHGVICEKSRDLHEELEGLTSGAYLLKIKEINTHENECDICKPTTFEPSYNHPMVARTVKLLGGLDAILSENPVADRARFVQAYTELLAREMSVVGMVPDVREYITEQSQRLLEDRQAAFDTGEREAVKQLTERMTR